MIDLHDPAFWSALAPTLHTDGTVAMSSGSSAAKARSYEAVTTSLRAEGWFQHDDALPPDDTQRVLAGILALRARGLHPAWCWAWDEPWALVLQIAPLWRAILGDDWRIVPAIWTWFVPKVPGERGWHAHVDRRNREVIGPDGSPHVISAWIPLTPALPSNGCMYVLPMGYDAKALATEDLTAIRALPARPGAVLGWNHAVWHWSGQVGPGAPCPRVNIGVELQRGDMAPVEGFVLDPGAIPDLPGRLRLIAAMIAKYSHMTTLDAGNLALAREIRARSSTT